MILLDGQMAIYAGLDQPYLRKESLTQKGQGPYKWSTETKVYHKGKC
jgi:hypothetical protein